MAVPFFIVNLPETSKVTKFILLFFLKCVKSAPSSVHSFNNSIVLLQVSAVVEFIFICTISPNSRHSLGIESLTKVLDRHLE